MDAPEIREKAWVDGSTLKSMLGTSWSHACQKERIAIKWTAQSGLSTCVFGNDVLTFCSLRVPGMAGQNPASKPEVPGELGLLSDLNFLT
jgi:hypothetical protein